MLTNDGRQQHGQRVVCYSRGASEWDVWVWGWRRSHDSQEKVGQGCLELASCQVRQVPYRTGLVSMAYILIAACTACTATHLLHVCTLCLLHILLHEYYLHRTVRPQCSSSHPILQALRQP